MPEAELFKRHVLERGILDPEGIHHEFASGTHGRKLDFDLIPDDDPLYAEWVALNVQAIRMSGSVALAVVGVANGTNRLARDVGAAHEVEPLFTRKISSHEVRLTPEAHPWLAARAIEGTVFVLEGVGTTGGTAPAAAEDIHSAGVQQIEGLFTWHRTASLTAFDAAYVPYRSISMNRCQYLPLGPAKPKAIAPRAGSLSRIHEYVDNREQIVNVSKCATLE